MHDPVAYMRQYRVDHPDYVKRHKDWQKRRAQENQVWINNYLLAHPCVDCDEKDPVVLEFDHVRGKKRYDVTRLLLLSIASILKEIAKCDVVCANCHTRRTAQRANTIRWRLNNPIPEV